MAGRKSSRYRSIDGVLLLDKPLGISSNSALQKARAIFQASKAGHTGSLDPLATGMLPICFGEATKFSSYLLEADKRYRTLVELGVTTTTGDQEGEVIARQEVKVSAQQVRSVLSQFRGLINQIPPMYSAVKHDGKRLYELARQGREVERKSRQVEIFELELIQLADNQLELEVLCSKGTYIRTLGEDIGVALGCGASLLELRRLSVSPFSDERCWTLESLNELKTGDFAELDLTLLPVDAMLQHYPEIQISLHDCRELAFGRLIRIPGEFSGDLCRLSNSKLGFIGLAEKQDDGLLAPKRMVDTNRLLARLDEF